MKQFLPHLNKHPLWFYISILTLLFGQQVSAEPYTLIKPGIYCADTEALIPIAEDLNASLALTMRARAAYIYKDRIAAINQLATAGTGLQLAASRGGAARTMLLIDAIIQEKINEGNTKALTWIPLLQTSLLTLPDNVTTNAAGDLFGQAQNIMQGDEDGNAVEVFKQARHMLACDDLNIPLQQAIDAQTRLMEKLNKGEKKATFNELLDALHNTLRYTVGEIAK